MTEALSPTGAAGGGVFDVAVIGGGCTGAALALLLARGGARTLLLERDDFGSGTSQESSNLVWGGIKYLERGEFALVRRLCRARDRLFAACPSRVRPVPFLLAVPRTAARIRRSRWALTAGALLYRAFTRRTPPPSRWLAPRALAAEWPRVRGEAMRGGLLYEDGILVDHDARFVFRFVRDAERAGAVVQNGAAVVGLEFAGGVWRLETRTEAGVLELEARSVVDTAGPWAGRIASLAGVRPRARHVFSKGVHLVLDRPAPKRAVLASLDTRDRPFFLLPLGPRAVVGTTDTPVDEPTKEVLDEDRNFLLDAANERFRFDPPLDRASIVAERCGVRPLVVLGGTRTRQRDWLSLSRRHVVEVDEGRRFVAVFGGKLTECVGIAEEVAGVLSRLSVCAAPLRAVDGDWFADPPRDTQEGWRRRALSLGLDEAGFARLVGRFGPDTDAVLRLMEEDERRREPLFAEDGVTRAEVEFTLEHEHVRCAEDFLRRRTRLALLLRRSDIEGRPAWSEVCARLATG